MPVGVVEPDHPLAPGVLLDRMDIADLHRPQTLDKPRKIFLLKIQLAGMGAKLHLVGMEELLPGVQGLEA